MTPNVVAVRQNLDLLVDGGKPVPGLNANDTTQWGYTLGNRSTSGDRASASPPTGPWCTSAVRA